MTGVGEGRGAPARGAGGAFASVQRARGPAELGPSGEPGPNPAGGMLVSEPRSVVFESERSAGTPVKALDHAEGTLGHADAGGEPRARWEGERPADSLLVMDAPASSSGKHTLSFGGGRGLHGTGLGNSCTVNVRSDALGLRDASPRRQVSPARYLAQADDAAAGAPASAPGATPTPSASPAVTPDPTGPWQEINQVVSSGQISAQERNRLMDLLQQRGQALLPDPSSLLSTRNQLLGLGPRVPLAVVPRPDPMHALATYVGGFEPGIGAYWSSLAWTGHGPAITGAAIVALAVLASIVRGLFMWVDRRPFFGKRVGDYVGDRTARAARAVRLAAGLAAAMLLAAAIALYRASGVMAREVEGAMEGIQAYVDSFAEDTLSLASHVIEAAVQGGVAPPEILLNTAGMLSVKAAEAYSKVLTLSGTAVSMAWRFETGVTVVAFLLAGLGAAVTASMTQQRRAAMVALLVLLVPITTSVWVGAGGLVALDEAVLDVCRASYDFVTDPRVTPGSNTAIRDMITCPSNVWSHLTINNVKSYINNIVEQINNRIRQASMFRQSAGNPPFNLICLPFGPPPADFATGDFPVTNCGPGNPYPSPLHTLTPEDAVRLVIQHSCSSNDRAACLRQDREFAPSDVDLMNRMVGSYKTVLEAVPIAERILMCSFVDGALQDFLDSTCPELLPSAGRYHSWAVGMAVCLTWLLALGIATALLLPPQERKPWPLARRAAAASVLWIRRALAPAAAWVRNLRGYAPSESDLTVAHSHPSGSEQSTGECADAAGGNAAGAADQASLRHRAGSAVRQGRTKEKEAAQWEAAQSRIWSETGDAYADRRHVTRGRAREPFAGFWSVGYGSLGADLREHAARAPSSARGAFMAELVAAGLAGNHGAPRSRRTLYGASPHVGRLPSASSLGWSSALAVSPTRPRRAPADRDRSVGVGTRSPTWHEQTHRNAARDRRSSSAGASTSSAGESELGSLLVQDRGSGGPWSPGMPHSSRGAATVGKRLSDSVLRLGGRGAQRGRGAGGDVNGDASSGRHVGGVPPSPGLGRKDRAPSRDAASSMGGTERPGLGSGFQVHMASAMAALGTTLRSTLSSLSQLGSRGLLALTRRGSLVAGYEVAGASGGGEGEGAMGECEGGAGRETSGAPMLRGHSGHSGGSRDRTAPLASSGGHSARSVSVSVAVLAEPPGPRAGAGPPAERGGVGRGAGVPLAGRGLSPESRSSFLRAAHQQRVRDYRVRLAQESPLSPQGGAGGGDGGGEGQRGRDYWPGPPGGRT